MADETGVSEDTLKAAIEALKQAGYNVLTKDQMTDRLRQATKEIGPLQEKLESLESEYNQAAKKLKSYEDRDKSAEQKIADELKAKQEMIDAWQQKFDAQRQATEQERQLRKKSYINGRLMELLGKSVNPRAAAKLALDEVPGLDAELSDSGEFRLTYTGPDRLPGDATEAISGWYKEQSFLHPPSGEGVPTGQVRPPQNGSNNKNLDSMNARDRIFDAFFPGAK